MSSNLRSDFNEVLDAFNFSEAYLIMNTLDRTWDKGTPSISEMKGLCLELFDDALSQFNKEGGEVTVMSGNFEVEINQYRSITLRFVPTETRFDAETGDVF